MDIFKYLNTEINNIIDDGYINYNEYENIIFTDGACNKKEINGVKPGGFSIYIDKSNINTINKLKLYKKINNINFMYKNNKFEYKVTNIRAEGYAILYTMIIYKTILIDKKKFNVNNLNNYILNEKELINIKINNNKIKNKNILIITDCEFWINVITKWSTNWYIKDIIYEKKNIDLILYMIYYYNILLDNNINIEFQHVKSHAEKKKNIFCSYAEYGNIEADKLAVLAKSLNDYNFYIY